MRTAKDIAANSYYRLALVVAASALIYFSYLAIRYSLSPCYWDHAEPNIAVVSRIFQEGGPLYHGFDLPQRYSLPYGPLVYIINAFFYFLIGPSIFSSKIGGVLAALSSIILLFLAFFKKTGARTAFLYSGYACTVYLFSGLVSFWNRPDPFILFFTALGLYAAVRENRIAATLLVGIALGAAVDLKIISGIYLLPILALFYARFGKRALALSLLVAVFTAFLPFIIFRNISPGNYMRFLFIEAGLGFNPAVFLLHLKFIMFLFLLLPLLFIPTLFVFPMKNIRNVLLENKNYLAAVIVATLLTALVGSKRGSGIGLLMPLVFSYVYLFAGLFKKENLDFDKCYTKALSSFLVFCQFILLILCVVRPLAVESSGTLISFKRMDRVSSVVVEDIKGIMQRYPKSNIEMGYGGDYFLTFFRPLLAFAGNHSLIDGAAAMNLHMAGKGFSAGLGYFEGRKDDIFLIPKGGNPFELYNYYDRSREVFSKEFKQSFFEHYTLKERTKYYDIWSCKQ